jgi:general secretion pathway protein C
MKLSPRYLVWVNLVLLAFGAYWGARTVNSAVAARLSPPLQVHVRPPPPPIEKEPRRSASYYGVIHSRDIFNSVKPVEAPPPETPKPTELRLKLWGVVVHDDGSSYCVIEDLTTRQQMLYRIDDMVASVARVKHVEWDKVILERDGKDEILEIEKPAAGGPVAVAAAGAVIPGRAGGTGARAAARRERMANRAAANAATAPQDSGGIRMVSEGQYEIDRSEVDSALDNMNQLFTQIRAVPHFQGGKSTGFRLFAIRQNSIFDRLGLRNGDIIQSVNGVDVSDASKALSLFQDLRNVSQVNVKYVRNKEEGTTSYTIR